MEDELMNKLSDTQVKISNDSTEFPEEAFVNREISQLAFFDRVLDLAAQERTPLLERLRFLTIFSSILDEFFEIRVGGLKERLRLGIDRLGPDKLSARDLLSKIQQHVSIMTKRQYKLLNQEIIPALTQEDVVILKRKDWTKKQKSWVKKYFKTQVSPVLTPVGLDPSHPFPQVLNKSLNMLLSLEGIDAFGRTCDYAVLHVPRCLPRVIPLDQNVKLKKECSEFVLLSSVIHAHAEEVFPGIKVTGCHQFRVTRHADLEVDEEGVEDLLDALKGELPGRRYGKGVRLEVANNCPHLHVNFLLEHFSLSDNDLYRVNGPVNLHRLATVVNLVDNPDLKYPTFVPRSFPKNSDMFELLQRRDILLHHPFQSFSPVVDLIQQAAMDPDVLAIKQTLYRTSKNSPFVDALIDASRAGKEVTAIIELRARFDEAANIHIADRLQSAGVHIVYGVVNYKTHAKMMMIVRRESHQLKRYVHLGTGNYHTGTAKAYTDFSLMSADPDLSDDVHFIFQQLTGLGDIPTLNKVQMAPFFLKGYIRESLAFEIEEAKAGRRAHVVFKVNSISDPIMIEALYQASRAGVKIDLIVRGICCLKPQLEGISENIHVRSIAGRFLEHTRIYYFYKGGEEKLYLASADLMQRNLYRRVEVAFPIESPLLKIRVIREGLRVYLEGNIGASVMNSNGSYIEADTVQPTLSELEAVHDALTSPDVYSLEREGQGLETIKKRKSIQSWDNKIKKYSIGDRGDLFEAQSWLLHLAEGN
jgi:polyphosphate kinase